MSHTRQKVWERFKEAPGRYPQVPDWLSKAKSGEQDDLFVKEENDDEVWPQSNEMQETALRGVLAALSSKTPQAAMQELKTLETIHCKRRDWVWAEMGHAPMACALKHLHSLATLCAKPVGGGSLTDMAAAYTQDAWQADAAVLDALAALEKHEDVNAVTVAIRAIYLPWLRDSARNFQKLVAQDASQVQAALPSSVPPVAAGTVILFADGLRYDVAQRLRAVLAQRGFDLGAGWRWAALPCVTPTAKPAASPIGALLAGDETSEEFRPQVRESGKPLSIERFRQLLEQNGYQVLRQHERGQPEGLAWTEHGSLDSTGHKDGWKLAKRVREEVEGLAERIRALLEAGWKEVKVVTDHGWLLLPGGLPKVELPKFLTDTRWGRCAHIREGAKVGMPTVEWHWARHLHIAVAPDISSFIANLEYTHGGLSLQECLVPEFSVRSSVPRAQDFAIESVKWVGLRCRIQTSGRVAGLTADLQTEGGDRLKSVTAKEVEADGQVSLLVTDDRLDGEQAVVVLLDADGIVVARLSTTVGQ